MATYILLTKLSAEATASPAKLKELEQEIKSKINKHCSSVKWLANYAILGPYDYLDIFEAPDDSVVTKVVAIIRSFGHSTTETWTATPWGRFKEIVNDIK